MPQDPFVFAATSGVIPPHNARTGTLLPRLLSLLLCLTALVLIIHTYSVYDQTWDEPATLAAGVHWYTDHTYTLDNIDPPLPRITTASLPYFIFHARSHGINDPWLEGNAILAAGNYHRILTAARIGTLPFFLLAIWIVWVRTRDWLGEWPAAIAVLFLCTCEPVLAHSGLSTTDVSFMATFFFAMDRIWQYSLSPSLRNALLLGLAVGLTLASKLSALPYLLLATPILLLSFLLFRGVAFRPKSWVAPLRHWRLLLLAALTCVLIVWSTYFFSIGPLFPSGYPDRQKATAFLDQHHIPEGPVFAVLDHLPAENYFIGLRNARAKRLHLSPSYFLGKVNHTGNIYFFPIALLVKTPIPLLLLGLAGIVFAVMRLRQGRDAYLLLLLTCIVIPVLFGIIGHVNQGLRHVLGVYPPLAMLAALAALELWQWIRLTRIAVALLLVWQTVACLHASPDFLPYFNEAAISHADYFLVDSDLDWGQDLKRVDPILQNLHADRIAIAYNGTEDLNRVGLPPWKPLEPNQPVSGWVVISDAEMKLHPDDYAWLKQYTPIAKAGHSIFIYNLP